MGKSELVDAVVWDEVGRHMLDSSCMVELADERRVVVCELDCCNTVVAAVDAGLCDRVGQGALHPDSNRVAAVAQMVTGHILLARVQWQ